MSSSSTLVASAETPALARRSFRHNPYAYAVLATKDRQTALLSFLELYNSNVNAKAVEIQHKPASRLATPVPHVEKEEDTVSELSAADPNHSGNDDFGGVSETSSDVGSGERSNGTKGAPEGFRVQGSSHVGAVSALPSVSSASLALPPTVIRYASVNFRFGSAWFVAPFRTFAGDMVVVQYPGSNSSLHMGLVSAITTAKPITFYTAENMDANHLSPEELGTVPRLLRHARDFDKEAKLDLRRHDLRSLTNARELAKELNAPVQFLDAEWLLDLSAVTFLVNVFGDAAVADRLVDELAQQEGAEVVFTYPVSASMY